MTFDFWKASTRYLVDEPDKVEINSLEDLIELSKKHDDIRLVVDFKCKEIILYDDYLE